MATTQYSLNWEAFQSSMCSGFSSFQQNGEFVDMTIAADGHMVKVHQIVMALASPFLKELINNAQCPHPVIYLNTVKHSTLCDLLEYIYTGEVLINAENLSEFMTTARGLHIRGLDSVGTTGEPSFEHPMPRVSAPKRQLPTASDIKQLVPHAKRIALSSNNTVETTAKPETEMFTYEEETLIGTSSDWSRENPSRETSTATAALPNLQFTVSNRGSLQVILNRYLYNLHSTAQQAGLRRWRCVDYRNLRCPAYVVTKDNVVVNRSNLHNHTFHDKKILSKIDRKCVFSHFDEVKGVKGDAKEADTTGEDDSFAE